MEKAKLLFWYGVYYLSGLLSDVGDKLASRSLDKLDILVRNNSQLMKWALSKGMMYSREES